MTKQELLNFDISQFDEPENAEAKLYLGYITTYAIRAIIRTKINHLKAKQTGKAVQPNKYGEWFRNEGTLGDMLEKLEPIDPKQSQINNFLASYEAACKRFLTVYDATYDEACSPENREDYYTVNILNNMTDALLESKVNDITNADLARAGYVDLRMPFVLSFADDKATEFEKNSYTDDLYDDYMSFESSLSKYRTKLVKDNRKK